MSTSTVRPSAVGTVTAFRAGDFILLPNSASGLRVITKENFNTELAALSRATPADGLATLNSSGKHDVAQINYTNLDPQGSSTVAALPDPSTLTKGQFYLVTDTGTNWSKTWTQAGEMALSDGTNYHVGPVGIATIAQGGTGSGTAAGARTNLDVMATSDVNDRTNAKQPLNGNYYDGTAKNDASNNAATDAGTGDFTIAALVTFPDSVSTINTIAGTRTTTAGYQFFQRASGALGITGQDTSANAVGSTDDGDSLVGRTAHVTAVIDRTANTFTRYVDGVQYGSVDDCSVLVDSLTNANGFHMGHRNSDFYLNGGIIHSAVPFNRALTAAEVLKLAKNGNTPDVADQWADNTTQTSGTLTVGQKYRIDTYVASDDFTNVGAASNATGVEFVATGTTPTTYSNGSTLRTIGAVAAYLPENIESDGDWLDASSNDLNAAATNVTPLRTKVTESGAFTPSILLGGSSAGQTYNTTNTFGNYKVINDGAHCHVWGRVQFNGGAGDKGSGTGAVVMAGLPKAAAASAADAIPAMLPINNASGLTSVPIGIVAQGSTQITLHDAGASGIVALDESNLLDTSILRFNFVYPI